MLAAKLFIAASVNLLTNAQGANSPAPYNKKAIWTSKQYLQPVPWIVVLGPWPSDLGSGVRQDFDKSV